MKHSQLKQLIKEEISNASTIDLAGKIRTLVYSTPFWKFRDAINMVIKGHYNRKVQLDEVRTIHSVLNEGKITIEDGDIEFIRVALNLTANTLKNKIRLTDDERNQLDNLLDKFGIDVKDRSGVGATASQLDRR